MTYVKLHAFGDDRTKKCTPKISDSRMVELEDLNYLQPYEALIRNGERQRTNPENFVARSNISSKEGVMSVGIRQLEGGCQDFRIGANTNDPVRRGARNGQRGQKRQRPWR